MIRFVTGTLGAGKTLHSVRLMIDDLCAGQTIVTNVELYPERVIECCARRFGVWVQPEQIRTFDPEKTPNWEGEIPWGSKDSPVHCVIDETHLFYNARDWATTAKEHKRMLDFLTQSRKAGVDVTWITQSGGNVDKQFRELAEFELAIVSSQHLPLGFLGKFPFKAYVVKNISARGKYVIGKKWFSYSKWLFGLYKTESFLNGQMRELSESVERVPRLKLRKVSLVQRVKLHFKFYLRTTRAFLRL